MNHIYKSIFNKALGVFTAVPEFASAHGKGSERTVVGRVAKGTAGFAASALAISVGLALTSTSAVAGPGIYINDGTDNGCIAYIDTHNSYVGIFGIGSTINVNNSMVKPGYTIPPDSYWGLDKMKPCLSSTGANATEHRSTQTNRTLFYGNNPTASVKDNGAKNLTLGGRLDVNSGIIGVGDRGTNGVGATNSIRMGTGTTLDDTNKHTNAIAIGVNTATTAEGAVAISAEAKARTSYSIAIGRNATAGGDMFSPSNETGSAIAIGRNSLSNFIGAVALGNGATVSPAKSDGNTTDGIAIGTKALVDSYRGMAIGTDSKALAVDATAVGQAAQASAEKTVAVGQGAKATERFTVAMGHNATASNANSVALGTNSATADVHTGDYTLNDSYTAAGLPNAVNGTVSVGSKGKERQIQNVAAGVISETSTDAINGSQLYATNNYLSNLAGGVKNVLGGNAAVDNAGNVTMSNIGGTGENTVDGAIKNLKTAIDSKADTTASVTSENAADIKVEKEAQVGNITNYKLSLGDDAKAKLAKAATALQTVEGDSNITATKDPADPTKVKLALKRDLTADSVTLGNTTGDQAVVNKDGLTIDNGPSVKKDGINAGNKKITGVADGNVALGSTDAVNGGQLAEVKSKADSAVQNVVSANPTALTVTKAGDTVTLTPNFIAGDLVNPATGEVNTPAADDADKLVTAGTVAKALAETHFVVDTKATTGGELDGASQANQKIKSSNKVTLQAGKNLKAKQTNGTDGAQVEFSLKDSISLTQVTAGTGDNQVVLGKDGVQVGGNTYINKDGINAAGKAISNVANGNVAAYSKDAVNGGQLHDTAKSMADVIGGGATVKDGKVVAGQNGIGNTGQNTVHGAIAAINQNTANNFNQIRGDLRKMDRDLRGSIAGTLATAGLPQAFSPGKSMVAAAAGTYRGQSGLAVGVSRISDNGKVILKVTGNTNSRGDFGGTIGAGYQW